MNIDVVEYFKNFNLSSLLDLDEFEYIDSSYTIIKDSSGKITVTKNNIDIK